MVEARVERCGEVILRTNYQDPWITREMVLERLALYIEQEQLNTVGECRIRAWFPEPVR